MSAAERQFDAHAQREAEYQILFSVDPRGEENREYAMSLGVYAVKSRRTGTIYVEKRIAISTVNQKATALKEMQVLDRIYRSGNPVSLNAIHAFYWLDDVNVLSLYLEYCDQGTVEDLIQYTVAQRSFTGRQILVQEDMAWHILSGLAEALVFLHYGILDLANFTAPTDFQAWDPILHLDIKPSNVFFSSQYRNGYRPRIVLGDFGCSYPKSILENLGMSTSHTVCGTLGYRPPEQDQSLNSSTYLCAGEFCDIWQAGGAVQALCRLQTFAIQAHYQDSQPVGHPYSQDLNNLIGRVMSEHYYRRPTAVELAREVRLAMLAGNIYAWPAIRSAN